jgi:hypothetical protein
MTILSKIVKQMKTIEFVFILSYFFVFQIQKQKS